MSMFYTLGDVGVKMAMQPFSMFLCSPLFLYILSTTNTGIINHTFFFEH